MDDRFGGFLLMSDARIFAKVNARRLTLLGGMILLFSSLPLAAQEGGAGTDAAAQEQVIQPQLDRREVKVPHINADDIELTLYTGILSMENFSSETVNGLRLAYHVTEDFFVEGAYARSTISDQFYRDRAFPITGFDQQDEDLTYYNLSLGYNVLPGEIFLGRRWAMASGVGTTKFANESYATFNFGGGYRILLNDWLAFHIDMRDYVFDSDLLGQNQRTNNFEATVGLAVFF
jgi:outer membrane beta-barrel protein